MNNGKLQVKSMAFAVGVCWGLTVLFVGAVNRWVAPSYGRYFLAILDSVYPGYHAMTGGKSAIIASLYALLDGAICGAVIAWLYNLCSCRKAGS